MKLFRRKKFESDMDTELGFHVDAYVDDLVRSGIDRTEAERRANGCRWQTFYWHHRGN